MLYKDALEIVKKLEFDKKKVICKDENGVELYILRPSQINNSLRNKYDLDKNFQIWLKEESREFRPNHLRLFIDLNLRVRSNPESKRKLLLAFDKIFYGEDPDRAIKELKNEKFEHFLNSLTLIANLAQFCLIEQDFNYTKESNFEPKTLFFQGWIREVIDSPKEIDNMCMSVARFQPPKTQYTYRENKKHKDYEKDLEELWYLNNS